MTNQILKSAADAGIALYVENGELKFKQTKPTFPSDLKASIIANKQALISLLANEQHSRSRIFPRSKENPPSQLPLSFSQQRLWLIDQLEGGSSHYNMPVALQVDGMFDVVAAEKALNTILARHEVLRTVYKQAGETVYQEVQTDVSVPFSMHDLQGMKMQSQREAIQSKLTEDARAHFDLSTDVMLRGSWLQQSATQGVLLFNIHHIASDGWSMSVLVDEFNQLYQAYAQGMDNPLAGLTLQYSDYALWQQEELVGEQLESQLSYWEVQLADAPVLHSLPLDNKRPQIRQYKGGIHDSELEDGLSVKLIQLASSQQVTSFMLMHAVLSILLAKHSNSTDIVIGTDRKSVV